MLPQDLEKKNRIPKKIHFFWGEKHTPPLIQFCKDSWSTHLPDYELVEWSASSLPPNTCKYLSEALEERKWAFVSDYIRLYALWHQGGIYLDTDVEIQKSLDHFLEHRAFIGFEDDKLLNATLIGAEPHHPWIGDLLAYYNDRPFRIAPNRFDLTPNPRPITKISESAYGLSIANKRQSLKDGLEVYPRDYFCPKNWESGHIRTTRNTHAIHHFNASWWNDATRERNERRKKLIGFFGVFVGKGISALYERLRKALC